MFLRRDGRVSGGYGASGGFQRQIAAPGLTAAEIDRCAFRRQLACRRRLAVNPQFSLTAERKVACGAQRPVAIYPGDDFACRIAVERTRLQHGVPSGCDNAAVAQQTRRVDDAIHAGIKLAAVIQIALRRQPELLRGGNAAVIADAAVDVDHHVARSGAEAPGIAYADAVFRPQQPDFIGIHAAKRRNVQRQRRCGPLLRRFRGDGLMRRIGEVAAGGNVKFLCPDSGIYLYGTGNQVGAVLARAVHACALHHNFTVIHVITGNAAIMYLYLAGRQRRAVRINKAAAVTGDPGGIGDNDLRISSGDFNSAVQLAGVAGVDFIEDNACFAFGEMGIAVHHPGNLRLRIAVAVIQDHAALIDVELAVNIARDAACARRLNVYLRRAVRRLR